MRTTTTIALTTLLILSTLLGACGSGAPAPPRAPSDAGAAAAPEIEPYVDFLRSGVADPVDYVLGLFDDHDVVILCERAHPEATQYELIQDLVRDPRFTERVGLVFTEIGGRDLQPELDALLATPGLSPDEVSRRLIPIYRELSFHPLWKYVNFFEFLRSTYGLNQTLPPDRRVRVVFTDLSFRWEGMTEERYAAFRETLGGRDREMAERIVDVLEEEAAREPEPVKALVIMNYRHAFGDFAFDDGRKGDNVGRHLFEAFPGRVANVMLNSMAVLAGSTDAEVRLEPIRGGRWDAAFRVAGVSEAGFDFQGSPFGRDRFDFFPFRTETVRYEDVFQGFVFFRPLAEHRYLSPVPGLLDEDFLPELLRRHEIAGSELSDAELEELLADEPTVETYDRPEAIEAMISRWIR